MQKECPSRTSPIWISLRNRLWQAALALTRSREDADDLTQMTIAKVLAQRPENIEHVGYIRRTMFRLWLDEQRSLRRRVQRMARFALTRASSRMDPDNLADAELHTLALKSIDTLPPQQHAVVVLRLIEELDYDEIASTLNCPVEAVRANLHLARKKMRRMMGEAP